MSKKTKITVALDQETHKDLKILCAQSGKKLGAFVIEMIEHVLKSVKQ